MANEFVTFSPYEEQLEQLRRRQRMADMLQQQAMEPLESQVAPGGYVVPTSPLLGLAKMLKAYQAGKTQRGIDTELADIRSRMGEEQRTREAEIESAGKAIQGRMFDRPARTPVAQMPDAGDQLQEITPTAQYQYDPQGAFQAAMTPAGAAAMQKSPMLASMLANMAKPKEPKEPTGTNLAKLIAERNDLPANSPYIAMYDEAIKNASKPSTGVTVNYGTTAQTGVDAQGNPVFFQTSPQGGAPSIVPGVKPRPEAMGAAESNAATFADRMTNANPSFDQLPPPSIGAQAVSGIPLVGNTLINARNRQFQQAEQDFISAVLRKESGAVISDTEYDRERKKYIPIAGDDAQTLEMKRKAREAALAGMRRAAGPAYKPSSSMPAPTANDVFSQADAIVGRGR